MELKNKLFYQQQLTLQGSRVAQLRVLRDMTREAGEKTASALGGGHLSFSQLLAVETEKQRRQLHSRQEQHTETKKPGLSKKLSSAPY